MPATITSDSTAIMRPYSIAVAPLVSARNRLISRMTFHPLIALDPNAHPLRKVNGTALRKVNAAALRKAERAFGDSAAAAVPAGRVDDADGTRRLQHAATDRVGARLADRACGDEIEPASADDLRFR